MTPGSGEAAALRVDNAPAHILYNNRTLAVVLKPVADNIYITLIN